MADQKISQLSAATTLTGTELVPIVQSAATVATTPAAIKTYTNSAIPNRGLANISTSTNDTTVGNIIRNGDWGFGAVVKDVPDLTATVGNYSQIGRVLAGATGGTGVLSGFVAIPLDGTPTITYLATANGRFWTGYKASSGGTPTWTEYAKLASPTFTTQLTVGGDITGASSFSSVRNTGVIKSDVVNAVIFDSFTSTAAGTTGTTLAHYRAQGVTLGASATLGNQYGFRVLSNLTAATNNYAYQSDLAAAAGCWNLYLSGTAQNYIRGNVGIGSGKTTPATALDVNGTGTFTNVAQSTANSLTAVGTNLATALALTANYNVITSAAASTGVSLPNIIGTDVWIFNNQATNAINVYAPTGTVNGGPSVSLAASGKMRYIQVASGVWYTMS